MAHAEPQQVERLVSKLDHPGFDIFIHIDNKVSIEPYLFLSKKPRVHFIQKRIKVRWAGYSFTRAVFQSMREVLNSGRQYAFINLMSGQDYPIATSDHIYNSLFSKQGYNFISVEKFGSDWWQHAVDRYRMYHLTDFDFKGRYRLQFILNQILPERKFPLPYTLYGGENATWWTLTSDCVRYILDVIEKNRRLQRFAKFTWAADEFLIPSIIMNSKFAETVESENFRYIDWSLGGHNPKVLTMEDWPSLRDSEKLIARKFDYSIDTKILDAIDALLEKSVA